MAPQRIETEVAVIGAGIVGIAVAYGLVTRHGVRHVALIDEGDPMALTSAQSGENYRNWWPHPVMTAFTDDSIGLMQDIARASGNRINMTRRGYALVTRSTDAATLIEDLHRGYGPAAAHGIRVHDQASTSHYTPATSPDWQTAPDGVDVLLNQALIRTHFPTYASDVTAVLHIRRAGAISGQQLGQFMLEAIRAAGGRLHRGRVTAIDATTPFRITLETPDGTQIVAAPKMVNAAGPFIANIAAMLGETLAVETIFQQKIAFEDRNAAIARTMPFTIDLDGQTLPWTDEERDILAADPTAATLLAPMPGGIHCRPDGGDHGSWIKLGWAYNQSPDDPARPPPLDPHFPDIVIRAASRLHPDLKTYLGRLPRNARHYGGYYTMTRENWPLIGPMQTPGAFIAGALSGYGTMAACASGALCAAWVREAERPPYAAALSPGRTADTALMEGLAALGSRGVL